MKTKVNFGASERLATSPPTAVMGMWVFLIAEFFFFVALFVGFGVYRSIYSTGFGQAADHLNVTLGTLNTALLLTSSFTMALAVRFAEDQKKSAVVVSLTLSAVLAILFLAIKSVEYSHEFSEGLFPDAHFRFAADYFQSAKMFFLFYFAMTAFHALHILIGIAAMGYVLVKANFRKVQGVDAEGIELVALYWHFVDVVWIFLFPLLYLLGAHA